MRASLRTVTVVSAVAGVALAGGLAFADGLGTPTPAPSTATAENAATDEPSDLAEATSEEPSPGIELPTGDPDPQRSDAPGDDTTTGTGTEPSDDDHEREGNRDADDDADEREGNRDADGDNGGRAAPAIANAYLRETATAEVLEACREANGTNKNLANWRGKLISAVAREFRGQSFGPDEEHVVTDFVEGRC